MALFVDTFTPNGQGHNHISTGGLAPGSDTLLEYHIRDFDPVTKTTLGPSDWTGWSSPIMRLAGPNVRRQGFAKLIDIVGGFDASRLTGILQFEVLDRILEYIIIPSGFQRGGVSLYVSNPEGRKIIVGSGSWHLSSGSI